MDTIAENILRQDINFDKKQKLAKIQCCKHNTICSIELYTFEDGTQLEFTRHAFVGNTIDYLAAKEL